MDYKLPSKTDIATQLDQWLEYGDLKELADLHLRGKYRYQLASKIKRGCVRNSTFMRHLIERAIRNKSLIEHQLQKLSA